MKLTVDLTDESVEQLVVSALKDSYRICKEISPNEVETLLALCGTLKYYMPEAEYAEWINEG
jgi:hypothetical protein